MLLKAINFAAIKHSKQRRKDPDSSPFINHPIGVAYLIQSVGEINSPEILSAAIL